MRASTTWPRSRCRLASCTVGFAVVGPRPDGAGETLLRLVEALRAAQADAGVGQRDLGRLVELVGGDRHEALDALVDAAVLAQIDRVVVGDVRLVRREAQRLAEVLVGELRIAGAVVEQREARVHVRIARILLERALELFLRERVVALLQVGRAELDVVFRRGLGRVLLLARLGAVARDAARRAAQATMPTMK